MCNLTSEYLKQPDHRHDGIESFFEVQLYIASWGNAVSDGALETKDHILLQLLLPLSIPTTASIIAD